MFTILMPKLGLTMTEGVIQRWLKAEGDVVAAGEELVEIETDKSIATVETPGAGTLNAILYKEAGTAIEVGQPIAYILEAGEMAPAEISDITAAATADHNANVPIISVLAAPEKTVAAGVRRKISPAAHKLAKEKGVDIAGVPEGPSGVVQIKQVEAYAAVQAKQQVQKPEPKATPMAKAVANVLGVDLNTIGASVGGRINRTQVEAAASTANTVTTATTVRDREISMSGMRKTIARRMSQSKREVPHFYLSLSVDMTNAKALMKGTGYKMSFHDVLIRVLSVALAENPMVNAHVSEEKIVLKDIINIGVAVAVNNGLIVPVVRDVKSKSLREISESSAALIVMAREGRLTPDDYQGGTFTVSNLGMFGIEQFIAIVNQPEAAILAVGKTVDTPLVIDGVISIRPMVHLTASFDHRAVDGAVGARFLARIKELLENPILLL